MDKSQQDSFLIKVLVYIQTHSNNLALNRGICCAPATYAEPSNLDNAQFFVSSDKNGNGSITVSRSEQKL
jgi:hypothetical protein